MFYLLYNDVFRTIHKHPLFVTRSCCTTFLCSPTYLYLNIADYQMCWPLGGLWQIFLQDIHVLVFHGPKGLKILIDQIITKN